MRIGVSRLCAGDREFDCWSRAMHAYVLHALCGSKKKFTSILRIITFLDLHPRSLKSLDPRMSRSTSESQAAHQVPSTIIS